ncbi:hypothetical protein AXG93_1955s1000 [Marchantia polymorpha subsp. ruderalis]|uniref:Uncharacterized protein n=1 Tax=Marchantia polymorpha subsp. ruderalis TaxID=1480154 RepID=A0A176W0J1_MARPO|nr:hypothetical protein AXG93_1955s1000 [Marchantia polymorpha subsp. ruderalis]
MEAGLLMSSCHERTYQLVTSSSQLGRHSRATSEASCSSSCVQLSCSSQISGRSSSSRLAGQRVGKQGRYAPSALNVRCKEYQFNQFKLPNQSKPSDAMKKPATGGAGGRVNRLPGNNSSPQGTWDNRKQQVSPPGLGQFRPPPSSYVPDAKESEDDRIYNQTRKAALFEMLSSGMGSWQERAVYVKEVQQLGVTSEELYEFSFVGVVKQTAMVVALQVYDSVVQSGASAETLEWYDEERVETLYALRTLSAGQRKTAAEFVAKNSLNVEEAQELAKAIKDHERRPQGREVRHNDTS